MNNTASESISKSGASPAHIIPVPQHPWPLHSLPLHVSDRVSGRSLRHRHLCHPQHRHSGLDPESSQYCHFDRREKSCLSGFSKQCCQGHTSPKRHTPQRNDTHLVIPGLTRNPVNIVISTEGRNLTYRRLPPSFFDAHASPAYVYTRSAARPAARNIGCPSSPKSAS